LQKPLTAARNRCADATDLNRRMTHSRTRVGGFDKLTARLQMGSTAHLVPGLPPPCLTAPAITTATGSRRDHGHAVWLYHRFALSFRDVEKLLHERGIDVTHQAIRAWVAKFGPRYAAELRGREARPGRTWHLDEAFARVGGKQVYLWRGVDEHGQVLDVSSKSTEIRARPSGSSASCSDTPAGRRRRP
jgi:hypothetical protein